MLTTVENPKKEPEEGVAPAKAAPQGPVTAMTEAQLIELDGYLVDKSYITGYTITQDDVYEFSRVKSVPADLVNLARWHRHIASYSDDFSTIPGEKRAPPQAWDLIDSPSYPTVRSALIYMYR